MSESGRSIDTERTEAVLKQIKAQNRALYFPFVLVTYAYLHQESDQYPDKEIREHKLCDCAQN